MGHLNTSLGAVILKYVWLVFVVILSIGSPTIGVCTRAPVIFNFGDSNSDTGGLVAGLGYPILPPHGRTFFKRSTGRLSDGRLIIDFLCQSLNTNMLDPYLDALGSDFDNGANFAVAGSTTRPKFQAFSLHVQTKQFIHFLDKSLELAATGRKGVISEEGFRNALYMIDIGQNDLSDAFAHNLNVQERVHIIISEIKHSVKTLYDRGAKKFWIHNTGPLGCLPQKLANGTRNPSDLDPAGCIARYNAAATTCNQALLSLCQQMKSEFVGATIVYVDIYSIKYDLIANAIKYGFSNPLMACCGAGGPPYNYNARMSCSHSGSQPCSEGSRVINWDGIHYTDAANAIIAENILSGNYTTPKTTFDFFCRT